MAVYELLVKILTPAFNSLILLPVPSSDVLTIVRQARSLFPVVVLHFVFPSGISLNKLTVHNGITSDLAKIRSFLYTGRKCS